MRKFATKIISRQNSVNQYFVFCLAYFVFCLAYLVFWLKNLVFVWCTWCLVYVVFCLAYIIYFWRTWCIFWRNWCLWHWDVVFLTFLNWDGASNIFITKNVQIYVFIPWINFPKSSSYRVLCGKRYASLKKVHHPRLWGLWQLSGVNIPVYSLNIKTTALLPTFLRFCPHISERHIYQHWMIMTVGRDNLYTSVHND